MLQIYGNGKENLAVPNPPAGGLHYLAALVLDVNFKALGILPVALPGAAL